jgi:hypothetical protein
MAILINKLDVIETEIDNNRYNFNPDAYSKFSNFKPEEHALLLAQATSPSKSGREKFDLRYQQRI